ncbi:Ltp family lipoprotein [Amycolatopsis sp. NPDC051371]|uniref:Ltp family lipoprotein n=1 Tax=Amycolatopsis sp. NPDC051371 TaxID=3155800 RepID=UPI003449C5F4
MPPSVASQPKNGLGTAGFVLGLIGLIFAFIPIIGIVAWPLTILGLIFGIVGTLRANRGQASNKGLAITAVVLSAIGLVICVLWTAAFGKAVNDAANGMPAAALTSSVAAPDHIQTTSPNLNDAAASAAATAPVEPPAPTTSEAPKFPPQVEQARASAQNYLSFTAFSRNGLIRQLSSSAGDGFPKDVATQAVDSLSVDWNAQAVKSAENYLSFTSFSCSGLKQQLSSSAGDGFTKAQAAYGAGQTAACK